MSTAPGHRPEEPLYEVVWGRRVELPPMGAHAAHVASILLGHLGAFAEEHGLGRASVQMLYRLDEIGDLQRRPDVSLVSYSRWSKSRRVPWDAAWPVVPDLAVEVVSPTDRAEDLLERGSNTSRPACGPSGSSIRDGGWSTSSTPSTASVSSPAAARSMAARWCMDSDSR
jgi:hypothetical protein